jgi:hypothetical protein
LYEEEASTTRQKAPPFEPAIKILKEREKNGRPEYFVLFATKQGAWAKFHPPYYANSELSSSRELNASTV